MELPRKVWVLQPSFKPKEIEVETFKESSIWGAWYHTASGKGYRQKDVYESKQEAIAGGWERVKQEQEALAKKQESLEKKQNALHKASGIGPF